MSKIHVLSEHLTNMIAAGEVVDRPANVVKECVENSIDAQAKVIQVDVYQGGIERIVIRDDGDGMDREDAEMAFMRHATSKMHSEAELFNIQTMGFRGEAIPSIASVARVILQTNNGQEGSQIIYNYGQLESRESGSFPKGTCIDVSGIFMKTPARFKHLRSISYEFSIIADLINKLALSHPEIRFTLTHDQRLVFQSQGNGNLKEIVYQMYGREVAENALPFEGKNLDFRIHGLAIQPKISRASKYFIFLSLNTRLIRNIPIQKAVLDAYSDYMPPNRFPIVILQVEGDTQLIDVNVHPNKWEVRMSKQKQLIELIRSTIQETLQASLKTVAIKKESPKTYYQEVSFLKEVERLPVLEDRTGSLIQEGFQTYTSPLSEVPKTEEKEVSPKSEETVVFDEEKETGDRGSEFFDHLQVLDQLHDSYILCSNPQGLVIIDQHAAQERYHYEQLQTLFKEANIQTQPLMVPLVLDVTSDIMSQLETINEKVAAYGIHFEAFGQEQIIVRQMPLWLQDVKTDAFFYDLLAYFQENQSIDLLALRKKVIATMACHSSIRFNRPLSRQEMEQVIRDLQKCKQPYHCPHGRPTVITLSDQELRKEFERG